VRPGLRRPRGIVHLVGSGPGDPGLITVRGRELLARADVVICDDLVPPELWRAAPPGAEVIRIGPRGARRRLGQDAINTLMVARARRGLRVVRLKGGDPDLFGRGGEEAEALRRCRIRYEIVPGVTAALGAAATTGIPLTHRRLASALVLATGHLDPGKAEGTIDWSRLASAATLVLYMTVERLNGTVRALVAAGRDSTTPAALVRWATRPEQQVVTGTLGTIAGLARAARLRPPALLIVGDVVRLRRRLRWFERRPLFGRTIVVTRPRGQASSFASWLEEQGARVLEAPALALVPPRSWAPLDRALSRLDGYALLIFTSVNGVDRFFQRLQARRIDVRNLRGIDLVAIGPGTSAAVEARGLRVAALPGEFRAEGIVELLARRSLAGIRVLIPRAEVARDLLPRALRRRGATVDVVPVYRAVADRQDSTELVHAVRAGAVDLVTFASSSTVTQFMTKFRTARDRRLVRRVPAGVIGPITAETARREGFRIVVMPRAYTLPALAAAIVRRLRNSPSGTPRVS
jgi:uroporphyrinogen III methyltransferase / synthase